MVDWVSLGVSLLISVVAILFAALTWMESRKQRDLLETMVKALPYVARPRRRTARKPSARPQQGIPAANPPLAAPPQKTLIPVVNPLKAAAEERRRLKLELELEKLQWQKNRDVARAIAWFVDRLADSDDDDYDE